MAQIHHYLWTLIIVAPFLAVSLGVSNEGPQLDFLTNTTADDLMTWEAPSELHNKYKYYLSGFDDDNRPIWIMELGRWNFKEVVDAGGRKLQEFDKYLDQIMYRLVTSVNIKSEQEDPVTDYVLIVDMDKFDLFSLHSLATLRYFLQRAPKLLKSTENIDSGAFVNVSYAGERFLGVMRAAMGGFFAKIDVYGTNKQTWVPKLLKKIPAGQLLKPYGGTKSRPESYTELMNKL